MGSKDWGLTYVSYVPCRIIPDYDRAPVLVHAAAFRAAVRRSRLERKNRVRVGRARVVYASLPKADKIVMRAVGEVYPRSRRHAVQSRNISEWVVGISL